MNISPTQIKKGRDCLRLIAYEYVLGQRPPSSVKQEFGTQMHGYLEQWLKRSIMPPPTPPGETARQGILPDVLPTPDPGLIIEQKFVYPWHGTTNASGLIDCLVPPELSPDGIPLVIDHKSTSNLKWAMTEDQLAKDPQGIIYAIAAMLEWGVPKALSRWVYYSATNPQNGYRKPNGYRKVQYTFDKTTLEFRRNLSELCRSVDEVVHIRENKILPEALPASPHSCGNYGGCYFRDKCNLTTAERTAGYFSGF